MSDPRDSSNSGSTVANPELVMDVREANAKYLLPAEQQVPKGYKQTEVGVIPEDWAVEPFQTLAHIERGKFTARPRNDPKYYGGEIPFIQTGDVTNSNGWIKTFSQTLNQEGLKVSKLFPRETLFFTIAANIGDVGFTCFDTACPDSLVAITPFKNIDKRWLRHELQMRKPLFENLASHNAQLNINLEKLRPYLLPIPPYTEQEAIAEALSDADALIETLKQLVVKKSQLKQGAMQELLTGKRRLPGFSGEWTDTLLGEALTIRHGKSQHAVIDSNGLYPILATGGQIGSANSFLYNKPSVLIGRKGTIDQPQFMDKPFWTVDTLFYSEIHVPNDAKFLFYRFCLIDWKKHNEASGVPSLNARTIEQIEIKLPQQTEQIAIAQILSDMDAEITELETKLAKARTVKQGMMQQLLTGRIRLR